MANENFVKGNKLAGGTMINFKRKVESEDGNDEEPSPKRPSPSLGVADRFLKVPSTDTETDYGPASKMMAKMGFQQGMGLGKFGQGRVDPVEMSKQKGRRGLGLSLKGFEASNVEWNFDEDVVSSNESVTWLSGHSEPTPSYEDMILWPIEENSKLTIDDETQFCSEEVLDDVLACKSVFDRLEGDEMQKARTRSNPYETIRGAIFLNRAAMKMANMDAVTDFMFTNPRDVSGNPLVTQRDLLYFADVCAGPGGFSEYMIWRKKCDVKGFGFTLRGSNDFKLENFYAASSEFFEPHYGINGIDGDGDIYKPENLSEFKKFVMRNTDNQGVHIMLADGGFSVEGQENVQEILSKRLYLCQFLCALLILRTNGSFVCKLFDIFTPFSVGLVYLMYRAFGRISIFKPVTSRPANSERYIICHDKRSDAHTIEDYLFEINCRMNQMWTPNGAGAVDIQHIVPLEMMKEDKMFFDYIFNSNNELGKIQAIALSKIQIFARNTNLIDYRQADMRTECMKKWQVPDKVRTAPNYSEPPRSRYATLTEASSPPSAALKRLSRTSLHDIHSVFDYKFVLTAAEHSLLLLSLGGSRVFKWDSHKSNWSKVDDVKIELPANTIVEAEFVLETRGEGKAQRKVKAVHLIDAMFLCGVNVSQQHFTERHEKLSKFAKAINRTTRFDLATVRAKEFFRLEEMESLLSSKLELRTMKGASIPKHCICCGQHTDGSDVYCVPVGALLIKTVKGPWMMAWSNSQQRKYFYNSDNRKTDWNTPKDSVADFNTCRASELFWSFEEGAVFQSTPPKGRELLLPSDVYGFIKKLGGGGGNSDH